MKTGDWNEKGKERRWWQQYYPLNVLAPTNSAASTTTPIRSAEEQCTFSNFFKFNSVDPIINCHMHNWHDQTSYIMVKCHYTPKQNFNITSFGGLNSLIYEVEELNCLKISKRD